MATLAQRAPQRSAAGGLSATAIDHINHVNSGLMIGSALLAFVLPLELLMFSYAVLGPLHYLTEISWLHDRRYFTTGRWDFVPLVVLTVLAFVIGDSVVSRWFGFFFLAFGLSIGLAFLETTRQKLWLGLGCVVLSPLVHSFEPMAVLFTIFLVTVVHVYVFTGVFILQGSFKSGRTSGFVSFAVFLVCGMALLLHRPPADDFQLGSFASANLELFRPLIQPVSDWMGVGAGDRAGWVAVVRFLGFAYTYHYLNWFSKTGIIRWHEVSRRRLAAIAVMYVASVGLYAYSYALGLLALLFLSQLHVLLEFPLDVRAITDVGRAIGGLPARAGAR